MVDRYHETLKVSEVASKLKGAVSEKYQWPDEVGEGYHLEFILHPDGTLILDFLNQETGFLRGPASYAKSYDIPVLYIDIQRVKRGYYTMDLEVLTNNPKELSPEEITKLYANKLEEKIKMRPELWLWSHRRWKHQPPI